MSSPVRKLEPVADFKPQPMVAIENVTMAFGAFVAVQDVNLKVGDGEFLSIVGPTGCGKSTILNAIAGLLKPAQGTVSIDGSAVQGVQNNIGYLFQQDALLPWKTAFQNVELGLMFRGVAEDERRAKVMAWLEKVGLKGFGDRFPHQLSGGQRTRYPHPPSHAERIAAPVAGGSPGGGHDYP